MEEHRNFIKELKKHSKQVYSIDEILLEGTVDKNNQKIEGKKLDDLRELTKLSVHQSLKLVKLNLNDLGIKHDNFVSETDIINNKEVDKVVKELSAFNPHVIGIAGDLSKEEDLPF